MNDSTALPGRTAPTPAPTTAFSLGLDPDRDEARPAAVPPAAGPT